MIVDVIFHIINTAVLGIIASYCIRKYLAPRIAQNMIMSQTAASNIVKRNDQLRKQEQGLVRAYYHQNYRYEELSHKVQLWNQKVEALDTLKLKEREAVMLTLDTRTYRQYKKIQAHAECKEVVRHVTANAPPALQTHFGPKGAQAYTHTLIAHLTRGDHHA